MKIQITYSNDSKSTIDLEHTSVSKVSIDKSRPMDIRVRVAFKDKDLTPLDLFFTGAPGAIDATSQIGPLVSEVAVFVDGGPVVTSNPNTVYDLLSNWFITGDWGSQAQKAHDAQGVNKPFFNF